MVNPVPPSQAIGSRSTESIRASGGASVLSRGRSRATRGAGPSTSMITPALSLATEPARPSRRARA